MTMTSTTDLKLTVLTQTTLVHSSLTSSGEVVNYNLIHQMLESATCAAQELANRQNGQIPPSDETSPRKWNLRELL